ncbi:MAG: phage tail tube protein [Actinomycetes bacterium]
MGNFLGSEHWIGFKPQAVAGTAETTVSTFLVTESIKMDAKPKHVERKTFIGTGHKLPSRPGWTEPEGSATSEVHASQPQPWYWALGNVVATQPAVSTDPTVYLHTITEDALAVSKQNSGGPVLLSVEGNRVFDKCKQRDAKINKITLKAKVGEVATLEIEYQALGHTDGATSTSTPTFVTDVLTCRAVIVKIDGTQDVTIDDIEIVWDNKLKQLPVLEDVQGAPHVIQREGAPEGSGKLKFIDFPTAQLAKLAAATTFALIVELDGDTISHAYKKFLRVTLPACQYTPSLNPEIADKTITGSASFDAFYDTVTGRQILVEAQNTLSAINT